MKRILAILALSLSAFAQVPYGGCGGADGGSAPYYNCPEAPSGSGSSVPYYGLPVANSLPGPVQSWPMNDGSGTSFIETIASNNMTFVSSIGSWGAVSGFPGVSFTFNGSAAGGTGAVASSSTATNFTNATPFSAFSWIETSDNSKQQIIVSNAQTSLGTPGWALEIYQGKATAILANSTAADLYILVQGSTTLSSGEVYQLGMTYDGSGEAAGVVLYVNGTAESPTVLEDNLQGNSFAGNAPPQIGWAASYPSVPFIGTIADVRIWNLSLTSAQVAALYTLGPR